MKTDFETAPVALARNEAESLASRNRSANLNALTTTQPRLVATEFSNGFSNRPVTWLFGRDGSLTAMDERGQWWAGCSLPLRAARAVLRTLDLTGTVACFLSPPHAAHVRVALESAGPGRAIVVVLPDVAALGVMLGCEDFSSALAAHRLWFACGEAWPAEMDRLFTERLGLPTPSQFIRLPGAEPETVESLVGPAQTVFANVSTRRLFEIRRLRQEWAPAARPDRPARRARWVCVVTGSRYRLWDDAATVLAETLAGARAPDVEWVPLDRDDPSAASPLALVQSATNCDAVVTADFSRGRAGPPAARLPLDNVGDDAGPAPPARIRRPGGRAPRRRPGVVRTRDFERLARQSCRRRGLAQESRRSIAKRHPHV